MGVRREGRSEEELRQSGNRNSLRSSKLAMEPETWWGESQDVAELSVSFGYTFRVSSSIDDLRHVDSVGDETLENIPETPPESHGVAPASVGSWKRGSFSSLSGAAMGANATLANTQICNGLIGEEILPCLDSPRTFRRLQSSPSFSRVESPMSPSFGSFSTSTSSSSSLSPRPGMFGNEGLRVSTSAPYRIETTSFLNAADVQTAGGAAGEDRVQAVCSEENGWLFCAIYDGFNGRDAADFLAGTLYETIVFHLRLLEWQRQQRGHKEEDVNLQSSVGTPNPGNKPAVTSIRIGNKEGAQLPVGSKQSMPPEICSTEDESFQQGVLKGLKRAVAQAESEFMEMVEQEMEDRPDLAMIGSCVLVVLLHGHDLYTLNLGDSRAVLATIRCSSDCIEGSNKSILCGLQLTQDHVVEEDAEKQRVLEEHPDDPSAIISGRVKGKIKLTRAFGAGYLKKAKMNDALMGILRVQDLCSPPYVSAKPHVSVNKISEGDQFVLIASDGLFDFFSNEEAVDLIHRFISEHPTSDPAKYMLEQLLIRAAHNAGMTVEWLKNIPIGRRRKYHDDVTVIVVWLGTEYRTSSASTLSEDSTMCSH